MLSLLPHGAQALPPATLRFPRDAGSHNAFKTEWWYVTGYALVPGARGDTTRLLGFQVTFFRSQVEATQGMQSRLAARHLLFAHAAVTGVQGRTLWHDQRIARWSGEPAGRNPADVTHASTEDTAVVIRDWHLKRSGAHVQARILASEFELDLELQTMQPVLLQGVDGLSRKGPQAQQASYYYSMPQLQVRGNVTLKGQKHPLATGSADGPARPAVRTTRWSGKFARLRAALRSKPCWTTRNSTVEVRPAQSTGGTL